MPAKLIGSYTCVSNEARINFSGSPPARQAKMPTKTLCFVEREEVLKEKYLTNFYKILYKKF